MRTGNPMARREADNKVDTETETPSRNLPRAPDALLRAGTLIPEWKFVN